MNRFKFSTTTINAIKLDEKRQYFYDEGQKGLRLSVTKTGVKSYQFQSRGGVYGNPVTLTIGRYGDITISEARKRAAELLSQVKQGIDPAAERAEKRAEKTLNEIFPEYVENHAKQKKRTWQADIDQFRLYFEKSVGRKKISEITKPVVKSWMQKIASKSGKITANRAYALLSVIFSSQLEHLPNPCQGLKKYPETSRERFLSREELKSFFTALSEEKQIYQDFFSLLLLTGARKSNVLAIRWDQIHDGQWIIPNTASKNKKSIVIPLASRAIQILESRRNNGSEFVFPGNGESGHLADVKKAWQRILKKTEVKDLRIHDLRRTFGSYQSMAGANMAIIAASLGHADLSSTAVYARLQKDPVLESIENATNTIFQDSIK